MLGERSLCRSSGRSARSIDSSLVQTDFNQLLASNALPNSLRSLRLSTHYYGPIIGLLPRSLTSLYIAGVLEEPIQIGLLPPTLTELTIIGDHVLTAGILPSVLLELTANEQIDVGALPASITKLTLGHGYGSNFNITPEVLPSALTHLTFGGTFNRPISIGVFPPTLTHLSRQFGDCEFGDAYCEPRAFNQIIPIGGLPAALMTLIFTGRFNSALNVGVLPYSLTHLEFSGDFNLPLYPGVLSPSITLLALSETIDHDLPVSVLPSSLRVLMFPRHNSRKFDASAVPMVSVREYQRSTIIAKQL